MNDFGGTFGAGRFSRARGRIQGGQGQGINYPSPFFDIAHTYLPTTVKQMFRWCRYYFFVHPLINAVVFKMSQYPITDLVYFSKDPQLKAMWKDFLEKQLMYRSFQEEVGLDYYCFHGDVKAVTKDGVFRLRDLVGKTAQVLSKDGVYRPATFVESISKQELLEVEFRDGRTVLATPDHQWLVSTSSGGTTKVTTAELKGRSIPRNVAPRPEKNDDYYEGVRHGFVFGDGTLFKDQEMLKYFEGHGSPPYKESGGNIFIHGMPSHYKQLPENSSSASYWYGFLCGFLAADGSMDIAGCTVLTQRNKAALETISDQLPRIGMIAGPVRGYDEVTAYGEGTTYVLSLFKQYILPEDLLLSHHRARFEDNFKPTTYGTHVTVVDVHRTGLFEKV
jgi:ribonucleoside-diphosphate reductase alpha chain